MKDETRVRQRTAKTIGLASVAAICIVAIAAAFVHATDIVLILFLGFLFSVFLSRVSNLLVKHSPLNYSWSLAVVTTTLIMLTIGLIAVFGAQVDSEISAAMEHADEGVEQLAEWSDRYPTVESIFLSTPFLRQLVDNSSDKKDQSDRNLRQAPKKDQKSDTESKEEASQAKMMEQSALRSTAQKGAMVIGGVFRSTFGLLVNSLLIFFIGVFLAIDPGMYRDGCVKLFPLSRRERTREIMNQMGDTLWHWLIGRFGTMAITGGGAGLLLWALGVPMAFTLGVITALLTFIPNIGSAVALVLAILFALPQGGTTVMYVMAGYIAMQLIESYVITPLIQQRQAALPPALLLAMQALMGVLFGFLGAAVASPLLAASKVAIEEAYIKDVLEQPPAN